jgi:fructosamine-3-kinase
MKLERLDIGDKGDFGLDEIVATGIDFHMERMNGGEIWFAFNLNENERISVFLTADEKGKLSAFIAEGEEYIGEGVGA